MKTKSKLPHTGAFLVLACGLAATTPLHSPAQAQRAASTPRVMPVTAPGLKKQIAQRRGQVVLVNFWATWCGPCVEEFPALVALQKRYAARGLRVLFVSADSAKIQKSRVEPFLRRNKVTVPSWIIKGDPFKFVPQFDPKLQGAFGLPRTYLYNRQGRLVRVFSEAKTLAEFEKLVRPLL